MYFPTANIAQQELGLPSHLKQQQKKETPDKIYERIVFKMEH